MLTIQDEHKCLHETLPDALRIICSYLEKYGVDVHIFFTGAEAWIKINSGDEKLYLQSNILGYLDFLHYALRNQRRP